MNPDSTLVEVWTEMIASAEPIITERRLSNGLVDQTLDFAGSLRMGRGAAFMMGGANERVAGARVSKTWIKTENNRTFLIEAVPYRAIEADLATLPPPQAALPKGERNSRLALLKSAEPPPPAKEERPMRMAGKLDFDRGKALVLDYILLNVEAVENLTLRANETYFISADVQAQPITIEGGTCVKYTNGVSLSVQTPVTINTSQYRPAIFTSMDDDTVGEKIAGSTSVPNGYYASRAIYSDTSVIPDFRHLRISYASTAIEVDGDYALKHCQITHCGVGLSTASHANTVDDVLFHDVGTAFLSALVYGAAGTTCDVRHITVNVCNKLTDGHSNSVMNLTNSLLVAVTSLGSFTTNYAFVSRENSASGVFQTNVAGHHYLIDGTANTNRNSGTTNIPSWLAADLRSRTTYPPLLLTNKVTVSTNLYVAVSRCTDIPDRGYHYPAVDYAANNFLITNSQVTINPGVVVASYGTNGIVLTDNSTLTAEGQPLSRVVFTDYRTVQEQSTNWGGAAPASVLMFNSNYRTNGAAPIARFRFADFTTMAGQGPYLASDHDGCRYDAISLMDCSVASALVSLGGNTTNVVGLTNNIFERTSLLITNKLFFYSFNNLFHNSTLNWTNNDANVWAIQDNAFDGATIGFSANTSSQSNNAYINVTGRITPTNNTEIILTNFVYTNGPLGNFYQVTTNFYDSGSRRATNAGLFHHTARADQSKEDGSIVDRGFHYVALNSDGTYLDNDYDDLPDYYEDKNGNGTTETNSPLFETDWKKWDTDGDGLSDNYFSIYFEYQNDDAHKPQFTVLRGKGFRVYGVFNDGPHGHLDFFLEPMYRGFHLNLFTTTDGFPAPDPESPYYTYLLPSAGVNLKYLLKYDFNTTRLIVSNSTSAISDTTVWRGNMMDSLGSDGPNSITNAAQYTVQNAGFTPSPFPPKRRYVWEGCVGSTSPELAGNSVHAPWWPILKMVSQGTNVFYTCGYNEGKWDLMKFNIANHQVIVTNVSRTGSRQLTGAGAFPIDIAYYDSSTIVVKYADAGQPVYGFDATTCSNKGSGFTFPGGPTIAGC